MANSKTPTIEELQREDRYRLILHLHYDEIIPFVQREFRRGNWMTRLFLWLVALTSLGIAAYGSLLAFGGNHSVGSMLLYFFLGVIISMTALVPLHEGLHGLAYKLAGAPRIQFGGNLRQFYFYAAADRFVVPPRWFWVIALMPFIVINFFVLITTFYVPLNYQWLLLGVLFMHTTSCAGDFGMLSFYVAHAPDRIYTYDEIEKKEAFFYREAPTV